MREEFKAPESWLAKIKEESNCNNPDAFLKCYRTSKFQVEILLMETEMCLISKFKVNARTGQMTKLR